MQKVYLLLRGKWHVRRLGVRPLAACTELKITTPCNKT